jgi:hypothetical protein
VGVNRTGCSSPIQITEEGLEKFLNTFDERIMVLLEIARLFDPGAVKQGESRKIHFIFGAIARTHQLTRAFVESVRGRQLFVSGALLRLHLDTYLRLMAKDLVEDKEQFFTEVYEGKQINKMVGRDGVKLNDSVLSAHAGKKDEWVPKVYKATSGYVHFSGKHCHGTQIVTEREDGPHVSFSLGSRFNHVTVMNWFETVRGFQHILDLFMQEIQSMGFEDVQKRLGGARVMVSRERARKMEGVVKRRED